MMLLRLLPEAGSDVANRKVSSECFLLEKLLSDMSREQTILKGFSKDVALFMTLIPMFVVCVCESESVCPVLL